jgi:hypothetical protein
MKLTVFAAVGVRKFVIAATLSPTSGQHKTTANYKSNAPKF